MYGVPWFDEFGQLSPCSACTVVLRVYCHLHFYWIIAITVLIIVFIFICKHNNMLYISMVRELWTKKKGRDMTPMEARCLKTSVVQRVNYLLPGYFVYLCQYWIVFVKCIRNKYLIFLVTAIHHRTRRSSSHKTQGLWRGKI